MKILVTGVAGFIGFHLANRLAKNNHSVIGIDNLNKLYYEDLKYGRLTESGFSVKHFPEGEKIKSSKYSNYQFIKLDIRDKDNLNSEGKAHSDHQPERSWIAVTAAKAQFIVELDKVRFSYVFPGRDECPCAISSSLLVLHG